MPFDTSAFVDYVSDPRYDLLQKPIKADKDNRAYELQFLSPATGKGNYTTTTAHGTLTVPCYNADGSPVYWDVYCGSDFKANMQGCALKVRYQCVQGRTDSASVLFFGVPVEPLVTEQVKTGLGWSIPWNFGGMAINTSALKLNASQTPVEQYINGGVMQHITTARYLKKYKKEALENNSMTFNTPCIESAFDHDTAMSPESQLRAKNWMGSYGVHNALKANVPNYGSATFPTYEKIIPLSDLFETCETPAIWTNTNRFRLELTFNFPDKIAFRCGPAITGSSDVYVFITDAQLIFDSTRMAPKAAIETASEKASGTIENMGYIEHFCLPVPYTAGQQLVMTGQRDLQEVILAFPAVGTSIDVENNVCKNPIQYHNGGLSRLALMYGSDMPFRTPLSLSGKSALGFAVSTPLLDTPAYAMFRKSCGSDRCTTVPLSLNYTDYWRYHMYFLPIFNQTLIHRNNDPKDVRIDTTDGVSHPKVVMIARKFAGAQVDSTGQVEKL